MLWGKSNEEGSVYIFIFLIIVLIYPFILYFVLGYHQQTFIAKGVKQSMNRAVTSAAMHVDVVYDYGDIEEGELPEEPPIVSFKINEDKARQTFDNILKRNLGELGFTESDYTYDLIIEGEIEGQFEWSLPDYVRNLYGGIMSEYRDRGDMLFDNPSIRVNGPAVIAILKLNNKGFFKSDEVDTYRVASSELVIPLRYENILDSYEE